MNIIELQCFKTVPDTVQEYSSTIKRNQTPLVIDNGSYECRVGWASNENPSMVFRNLIAKPRREKVKKDGEQPFIQPTQIGNDIINIEAMRYQLRTQFDRNVVTHYHNQEQIFDHIFKQLSIDTENCVNHPIVLTECVANPNYCRQRIRKLDDSSFELLGAPILRNGLVRMLISKNESVKNLCSRLELLDVHQALCLFRHSISSPKFIHLLRTSPTFEVEGILKEADELFRTTLESISNAKIDGNKWLQASLPMSLGGLGIRRLQDLSYPAYWSSLYKSADLSNLILQKFNLNIFDNCIPCNIHTKYIPESDDLKKIQESWDLPKMRDVFDELLNHSEPVDRARLLASLNKESSKWLQVVPSSQLGLFLDNDSARIAIALRLGCQICEKHRCVCGEVVDINGHHGLSCIKTGGHFARHADINKILSCAMSSARIPNILEPPGLSRDDGKNPDGMTLTPWSYGKAILWDATVGNTLAKSYLHCSSKASGSVAEAAERRKHNHYMELKNNYHFTPVAFETLGCMGPDTRSFLNTLGKLIRKETGEPRSLDFLLQKISISIQRGNAACILGTFGNNIINKFVL